MKSALMSGAFSSCLFVLASSALANNQTPRPRLNELFPLSDGAEWVYSEKWEAKDNTGTQSAQEVRRVLWEYDHMGSRFMLRDLRIGAPNNFSYWSINDQGLYSHTPRFGDNNLYPDYDKRQVLDDHLKTGYSWTWTTTPDLQTLGTITVPPSTQSRITHTATIESMDEPVLVPAGEFRTVKVVEKCNGILLGTQERTTWFAKGIGIVKEVESWQGNQAIFTRELKKYVEGVPFSDSFKLAMDHAGVKTEPNTPWWEFEEKVQAANKKIEELRVASRIGSPEYREARDELSRWEEGQRAVQRVVRLDHGAVRYAVRSDFFQVKSTDKIVRVYKGKATDFDPLSASDWQKLIDEEGLHEDGRSFPKLTDAVRAGAWLAAAKLQLFSDRPSGGGGTTTRVDEAAADITTRLSGTSQDNSRWTLSFGLVYSKGTVTDVDYQVN